MDFSHVKSSFYFATELKTLLPETVSLIHSLSGLSDRSHVHLKEHRIWSWTEKMNSYTAVYNYSNGAGLGAMGKVEERIAVFIRGEDSCVHMRSTGNFTKQTAFDLDLRM